MKRSIHNDEQRFKQHIQPLLGLRLLSEITLEQAQQLQTRLLSTHKPATNNRILTLLKGLLKLGRSLWYHPGQSTQAPAHAQGEQPAHPLPGQGEIRRLFIAAELDDNYYAAQYVKLLLLTGLRRDELRLAKWEHVSLEQGTLFIPHTKNGLSASCT